MKQMSHRIKLWSHTNLRSYNTCQNVSFYTSEGKTNHYIIFTNILYVGMLKSRFKYTI